MRRAIQQGAVLAAQVLHVPLVGDPDQRQMLARKAGVVGITKLIGAGAAERDAVAIQRDGRDLSFPVADDNVPDYRLLARRQ